MWWENFSLIPGFFPIAWANYFLGMGRHPQWTGFLVLGVVVCGWIVGLYLLGASGKVRLAIAVILGSAWSAYGFWIFSAFLHI